MHRQAALEGAWQDDYYDVLADGVVGGPRHEGRPWLPPIAAAQSAKIKNPVCAAVKREAEKDWGKRNGEPLHRLERKLLYRLDGLGGTAPPLELQIL